MGPINPSGNIFLTNIHRVYDNQNEEASIDDENTLDYFLGKSPREKLQTGTDLGRYEDIDSLVVINDEAHHIHNGNLLGSKLLKISITV